MRRKGKLARVARVMLGIGPEAPKPAAGRGEPPAWR